MISAKHTHLSLLGYHTPWHSLQIIFPEHCLATHFWLSNSKQFILMTMLGFSFSFFFYIFSALPRLFLLGRNCKRQQFESSGQERTWCLLSLLWVGTCRMLLAASTAPMAQNAQKAPHSFKALPLRLSILKDPILFIILKNSLSTKCQNISLPRWWNQKLQKDISLADVPTQPKMLEELPCGPGLPPFTSEECLHYKLLHFSILYQALINVHMQIMLENCVRRDCHPKQKEK